MHFFPFLKLVILWMICHQIFSVAVCVELTEFLDINFKMPIFKPKFNFFKFLKPIRLSIPGGFWPCNFFPDILILRGQNYKIIGVKKLQAMTLQFEALGVLESKSWRKETPILNKKKWGLFSLTFLSKHSWGLKLRSNVMRLFCAWIFKIWPPSNQNIWQQFMRP